MGQVELLQVAAVEEQLPELQAVEVVEQVGALPMA